MRLPAVTGWLWKGLWLEAKGSPKVDRAPPKASKLGKAG